MNPPLSIADALLAAKARLTGSDSAQLDAELLLGHVLHLNRAQLFTRPQQCLTEPQQDAFSALIERRVNGEPVAYLLGTQGFWTLTLRVGPAVLVPRPETELLVEWALQCVRGIPGPEIADLGTGSGAIALALASERADARVTATDVSADALALARANARGIPGAVVDFRQGSWFVPLPGARYDLIVSNPPYIAAGDAHLAALAHEPTLALSDGGDGLGCLRALVAGASAHLKPGAWLLLEHGYDQADEVQGMFASAGFERIETRRDLGGQPRATGGCWHG